MARTAQIALTLTVAGLLVILVFVLRDEDSSNTPEDELSQRLERLRSLPYTSFTADTVDAEASGVRIYVPDKAFPGYNLYCYLDSLLVKLIDMRGNVVHSWSYPQRKEPKAEYSIMLENGDVLVLEKFRYLFRLDWDSRLIWKKPMHIHHEVTPLADGTFYVILREVKEYRGLKVRFPAIAHLSSAGDEIDRWSSYDHLDELKQALDPRSFFDTILDRLLATKDSATVYRGLEKHPDVARLKGRSRFFDYFHMNTITILPDTRLGREDPRFKPGNLLICFRNVNQIAVLDKDTKKVLWAWGEGILDWPHHPTLLDNGNILVFDNGSTRDYSRVLEVNPLTGTVEWEYKADPPNAFYSYSRGSAQRLPNGNTLICESEKGRAFEITKEGEIVWEWLNPDVRDGRRGQIHRLLRIDPEVVEPLLERDQHSHAKAE